MRTATRIGWQVWLAKRVISFSLYGELRGSWLNGRTNTIDPPFLAHSDLARISHPLLSLALGRKGVRDDSDKTKFIVRQFSSRR